MRYRSPILAALALVSLAAYICNADLVDDFEDGDYTSNPTWLVVNDAGEATVVADPIRPDNLVLVGYGGDTDQHRLRTIISHPRAGLDLRYEFCAPAEPFDMTVALEGSNPEVDALGWQVWMESGLVRSTFTYQGTTWNISLPGGPYVGQWWDLHLWNEPGEENCQFEIDFGDPQIGGSFGSLQGLNEAPPFESVSIAFGGTSMEYVDNIHLTTVPEPANMLLIMSVLLGVLRRR